MYKFLEEHLQGKYYAVSAWFLTACDFKCRKQLIVNYLPLPSPRDFFCNLLTINRLGIFSFFNCFLRAYWEAVPF